MLHRDFVPWRFSNAGRISARLAYQRRRPKTCTNAGIKDYWQQAIYLQTGPDMRPALMALIRLWSSVKLLCPLLIGI